MLQTSQKKRAGDKKERERERKRSREREAERERKREKRWKVIPPLSIKGAV
jgi:hypothetical protein